MSTKALGRMQEPAAELSCRAGNVGLRKKSASQQSMSPKQAKELFRNSMQGSSRSLESFRRSSVAMYRASAKKLGAPEQTDPAPNGGWGWVVVASSFIIHLNVLGLQYSYGVMYKAFRDDETLKGGDSRAAAAVAGSIASSLMLLFSLPAGILVKRCGPRLVSAGGAVLIFAGLSLSSVTSDLRVLYLTYGVIGGMGFGVCWAPSVIAVQKYFTTRRALASGIAVAGSGVGTVVWANVCNHLIQQLGWRGAMFQLALISGITNLLSAVTFFPIANPAQHRQQQQPAEASPSDESDALERGGAHSSPAAIVQPHTSNNADDPNAPSTESDACAAAASQDVGSDGIKPSGNDGRAMDFEQDGECEHLGEANTVSVEVALEGESETRAGGQDARAEEASAQASGAGEETEALTIRELWSNRSMVIIGATMFVYAGSLWIPYTFLVAYAMADGGLSDEKAAQLVALIGIASTVGRVVIGAVSVVFGIRRLMFLSMLVTGTALVILAALTPSFGTLLSFSIMFGTFAGSVIALVGPILVEQLGILNFPAAFGLAVAVQAPAVVLGPPLGGWLRDATGVYSWTFGVPGGLLCLCSLGMLLLPDAAASKAF